MSRRSLSVLCCQILILLVAPPGGAIDIAHDPVDCIVVNTFPLMEAGFQPSSDLSDGRLYFKAAGTADWYFVGFEPKTSSWMATLPKPAPGLEAIDYYVHGNDVRGAGNRTELYHPIVSTRTYCENQGLTVVEEDDDDTLGLVIGILEYGQDAIPQGFLSEGISGILMPDGIVKSLEAAVQTGGTNSSQGAQASSGSSGTAAGAGAAAGGGGSAAAWVLGGLAVAGGAYYATEGSSDDEEPGCTTNCDVTSRNVTISVVDHNAVQDDFYDLYVNGTFIGPIENPPGGTTSRAATLQSGSNLVELRLTEVQCCSTALTINIEPGGFSREFVGTMDHSWTIFAP